MFMLLLHGICRRYLLIVVHDTMINLRITVFAHTLQGAGFAPAATWLDFGPHAADLLVIPDASTLLQVRQTGKEN